MVSKWTASISVNIAAFFAISCYKIVDLDIATRAALSLYVSSEPFNDV